MKISKEHKLAFKITILISFVLLFSFLLLIQIGYNFILNSEKNKFLLDIKRIPRDLLVNIIIDKIPNNQDLPTRIAKDISKKIMFETIRNSLVIKNDKIIEKKWLFKYLDIDINILKSIKLREVKNLQIEWYNIFIFKLRFKNIEIFLLRDVSWFTRFYKFLLNISIILLLVLIMIIYFISLILSKITIKPIKKINKKLKEYNHNIAHELKTPISIIKSNLELLEIKKDKDLLNSSKEELNYMTDIINSLLFLSTINKIKDNKQIDLNNQIKKVIEFNNFPKDRINILKINNKEIFCNKVLLDTLLKNLIENAIKYSPKNVDIDIKILKNSLIISNKFIGDINKKDLQNLFDTFYQLDNSRNRKWYWLGLSIVSNIVNKFNWKIKLKINKWLFFVIINF